MLVLTRRTNEEIVIPQLNTTIKVLHVTGGRVKLAIDAPSTVRVMRKECQRLHEALPESQQGQPRLPDCTNRRGLMLVAAADCTLS